MYAMTAEALQAVRGSHGFAVTVQAWLGGARVLLDGVPLNLPVLDGTVTVDAGSRVRRKLSMTTPASDQVWDALSPTGVELKPYRGIRFANGQLEWIPLGVFGVDEQAVSYGPDGTLQISAPDRWALVQAARFERIRQTSGNAVATIVDLVTEAVPGLVVDRQGVWRFRAARARWPEDRDAAIGALARAASVDVAFDPVGRLRIRPAPTLGAKQPVWRVDAGVTGVQLTADRTRSRQKTYNVVCVRPDSADGSRPFPLVTVADMDPASDTWVGGPFGRSVMYHSNPLIKTAAQARQAAFVLLDRSKSLAAQLNLTAVANPGLEDGDVIGAILPRKRGAALRIERHLVESCTVPLTAGGTQAISTRSTRPDDADVAVLEPGWLAWQDVYTDEASWSAVAADYATWNDLFNDVRIGGL